LPPLQVACYVATPDPVFAAGSSVYTWNWNVLPKE